MGNDDSRHDKPPRQRSSVADVIAEIKGETPKAPTLKDLPPPKSQLDKLYEELGGPADLGSAVDKNSFRRCCGEYSLVTVLPILRQFAKDETSARRHWPWAAYAINQYKFDIKELAKYRDEPRPKEIRDLVAQIRRASHDLSSALAKLQTLSFRLHDHTSPLRRGHLTWLNYVISQALADKISNEVIGDFVTIDLKNWNSLSTSLSLRPPQRWPQNVLIGICLNARPDNQIQRSQGLFGVAVKFGRA
jgi:hypothetical protein